MTDDTTATKPIRVLVWDEAPTHAPKSLYPDSINGAIASGLNAMGNGKIIATAANLDDPEQGCRDDVLHQTDVLFWWGHARHREVSDDTMMRVYWHVHERGMGFVALHSAHYSKTLQAVLGCPGHLKGGWREETPADVEEITVCAPHHPIAKGVSDFVLSLRGDVRRALRRSAASMPRLSILLSHRRRIFPLRHLLDSRAGQNGRLYIGAGQRRRRGRRRGPRVLLPPRPRNLPDVFRQECANGAVQCGVMGSASVRKKEKGERQKRRCRYFLLSPFSFSLA